ncbi:hypothetical protein GJ496_009896 [Pomphorhynchus laevis]|nr:hypothetical protein GJ496_009896 [Pomphorhynchus laevis]
MEEMAAYNETRISSITSVQSDYECCGLHNYTDWITIYNLTDIPDSCCSNGKSLNISSTWMQNRSCYAEYAYKVGCSSAIFNRLLYSSHVSNGITMTETFGLLLCLACLIAMKGILKRKLILI